MKYLSIDYGKRKVGLALSEGNTASPFKVVEVSGLSDALQQIIPILKKEEVDQVVIGISESGESRSMTEKFINELKKEIEVVVVDETLSSYEADNQLSLLGVQKSRKGRNDAMAAAIILQNYLDR